MKHFLPIVCGLAMVASATAQTEKTKMIITLQDDQTIQYTIDEIKNITFDVPEVTPEEPTPDALQSASIAIPTDFSACRVQKVMLEGKQIAEIDYEYIKAVKDVRVVIYPMGEDGKADLTNGISATDGGTVVWDLSANTATYTAGEAALTTVYYVDGKLVTSTTVTDLVEATVEADLLVDVRGSEATTYQIVKIGTQYWMAENLRATRYANGGTIEYITSSDTSLWTANTTGAYHIIGDDSSVLSTYGGLYNGYAVTSDKGLAPEGWEVPTKEQWITLRKAGNSTAANFKLDDSILWGSGYEGTNLTGFSAFPCGIYSATSGEMYETTDAWWWTSTQVTDWLTKKSSLETARINASASKNIAVSDSAGHDFTYGHSVRCVRK